MRKRAARFYCVMLLLLVYTSFKVAQLLPGYHRVAFPISILVFFLMLGGTFISRARPQVFDAPWFRAFTWVGSVLMGLWATFVLISLPFDAIHLAVSVAHGITGARPAATEGPAHLRPAWPVLILALSGGLALVGFLEALLGPRVRRVAVPIAGLRPELRGLKIVQISDLHIGPTLRGRYVEKVIRRANREGADFVFVTGDLADAPASSIAGILDRFKRLGSRYGIYYVTGNHEYYWDPEGLIEQARAAGLLPLLNESRVLRIGDARVLVAGITDPAGAMMDPGRHSRPDSVKALRTSDDERVDLRILLAHRPDAHAEAERLGVDLQLSGHTHSGQFFPFAPLIRLAHRYRRGLYQVGRMWLYVNPGTGYWGPANRLGVVAEITSITLGAAQAPFRSGPR